MSQLQTIPGDNKTLSPGAIYQRKRRAKLYAAGLTCFGRKRINKRHPELHGLNDKRLWNKLWSMKQ
jgi:hypothetical protein